MIGLGKKYIVSMEFLHCVPIKNYPAVKIHPEKFEDGPGICRRRSASQPHLMTVMPRLWRSRRRRSGRSLRPISRPHPRSSIYPSLNRCRLHSLRLCHRAHPRALVPPPQVVAPSLMNHPHLASRVILRRIRVVRTRSMARVLARS